MERSSNMKRLPKIYTASKLHHAPMWRELKLHTNLPMTITSRWISMEHFDDADAPIEQKRAGWIIDETDVRESDYVLVFAAANEPLRGALVEAGMGIAYGKKIVCCGQSDSFGTWQYHPQVIERANNLQAALQFILLDWQQVNG